MDKKAVIRRLSLEIANVEKHVKTLEGSLADAESLKKKVPNQTWINDRLMKTNEELEYFRFDINQWRDIKKWVEDH